MEGSFKGSSVDRQETALLYGEGGTGELPSLKKTPVN